MAVSSSSFLSRTVGAGVVLAAAVVLSGCSLIGGLTGNNNVFTLKVGDCFDAPGNVESVSSVAMVECSEPHDLEVSKSVMMGGDTYPGIDLTMARADEECVTAFEEYTGRSYDERDSLDFDYFYPTEESWATGDREILCLVFDWDDALVGSVKNIGPAS